MQSLENIANLVIDARGSKRQSADLYCGEALGVYAPTNDQKRLYLESVQSPRHSLAYHIAHSIELSSEDTIQVEQLRSAILQVVARNDSLRSTFTVNSKGETVAKVLSPSQLPSRVVRILQQPEAEELELREAATSFMQRWATINLNLSVSSFDTILLPLSKRCVVFAFKVHHIVFDGFSAVLLAQRITAAYMALIGGSESTEAKFPPQFSLMASAQDLEVQEGQKSIPCHAIWKSTNAQAPRPFERQHRNRQTGTSQEDGQVVTHLSATTSRRIQDLFRAKGHSTFTFYLTAFMQLLSDFEMQEDFFVA